jgi:hypothetical protein
LFLLFWICICFCTPTAIIGWLDKLTGDEKDGLFSNEAFNTWLSTQILVIVNSVLIPFFITLFAGWEDFYSKSERQISIMNRNLFFMLINTLFIPLLGGPTLAAFLSDNATTVYKLP